MVPYTYWDIVWKGRPVRLIAGGGALDEDGRAEKLLELFKDCGRVVIIRALRLEDGGSVRHNGDEAFVRDFAANFSYSGMRKPKRGTI